jgi:23S rRNA (pseudouridine1915-N3)-methyltransferase
VLHEIPAGRRTKGADLRRLIDQEGTRQLAAIPAGAHVVALDLAGKQLDTESLARELRKRLAGGEHLALLVGGPEGLAPACLERARERWGLSKLTLAHPVVRVVLAEQLYRAWSIIANLPYHR